MDDPRGMMRPDLTRTTWVDVWGARHAIGDCWHDIASESCEPCNVTVGSVERRKVERDAEVMRQWRDGEWVGSVGSRRFVKVLDAVREFAVSGMGHRDNRR